MISMCFENLTRWVWHFYVKSSVFNLKWAFYLDHFNKHYPHWPRHTTEFHMTVCLSGKNKTNNNKKNQQNKTLHTQFIWIHEHTWTVEKWGVSVTTISHLIGRVYISRQDQTGFPTQWTEGSNTSPVFHHTTKVTCHLHHHCACLIWLTH